MAPNIERTIIVQGNPVDGFHFHGPFDSSEEAQEAADQHNVEPDWWLASLFQLNDDGFISREPAGIHEHNQLIRARGWLTPALRDFFAGELANERNGGISPATLSVAIDSLSQGGADVFGLTGPDLLNLSVIRDMLPGETPLTQLHS